MVKKFFIGLGLVLFIGLTVGSYYFQRSLEEFQHKSKLIGVKSVLLGYHNMIEGYKAENDTYPTNLQQIPGHPFDSETTLEYQSDGSSYTLTATNKQGLKMKMNEKKEFTEIEPM